MITDKELIKIIIKERKQKQMKKKDLLQKWEQVQRSYLSYLDKDELEREHEEWFGPTSLDEMINELMESELDCRRDDSIEELKETIEHIKSLSRI
tara:strand:- start:5458 stop:5742 length:285 start_codon:yes stop_codon:yes gene_type:complete